MEFPGTFIRSKSRQRPMQGYQDAYGANQFESGLSAVSLRPCGPQALIPVNGKKNEIGGKIRTEK